MADPFLNRRLRLDATCFAVAAVSFILTHAPGCAGGQPPAVPRFGVPGDTTTVLSRTAYVLDRADGLREPVDVAIDPSGRVLVLDAAGPDLLVFDVNGRPVESWPVSGASDARFFRPTRLTTSGLSVLLMDTGARSVHRYDLRGQYQGVALDLSDVRDARAGFIEPVDIAADNAGQLYVTEREGHRVLVFDQGGRFLFAFGGFGSGSGQFRSPGAVSVDATGTLAVADRGNHRVQLIDAFGTPLREVGLPLGADGGAATPVAVETNRGRTLFVADDRDRLLTISPGGRVRLAHRATGLSAFVLHPTARVFCLSAGNARVEAIDLGGR
jgi:DNA-binding beta-propeller fold protein YncE